MSLINFGAGIAALGDSVAKTAGEGALETMRAQLDQQKLTLASQLAGQPYDVQAKRLALIPQQASVDAYLKMTGHPGGLADFGMAGGAAPAAGGAPAAAAPASAPASPAAAETSGSSAPPATAAAPAQPQTGGSAAFPNGAPIVAPVGDKGKVMGLALPPGVSLEQAQIMGPDNLAKLWAKYAEPQNMREGSVLTYYDFASGQQKPLYQQPKMPEGTFSVDGKTVQVVGANEAIRAAAAAKSGGEAQGALGAKETQAAYEAGLKVRAEDDIAQRKAFYETGIKPPAFDGNGKAPITAPNGDIGTPAGTVSPAPPQNQPFRGTDAQNKENTNTQEVEKNFGAVRATLDQTESRLIGLANAQKIVQSAGFNEQRADLANNLRGLGLKTLADLVMSEKDTAKVQTQLGLQTQEVLGQLKQINAGTGGRILNSEFTAMLDKQSGPNLAPQANFDLITTALGGVYQTRSMIDDYNKYGKPQQNWRDANGYISAYYSDPHNQMPAMLDKAEKAIGPLKGMQSQPVPLPPASERKVGTTYPTPTGQRKWMGNGWSAPIQTGAQ